MRSTSWILCALIAGSTAAGQARGPNATEPRAALPSSADLPARGPGGPPPTDGPVMPSRPAEQTRFTVHLDGVSSVQLAWWFQHIADEEGVYWKALAPRSNRSIEWAVNPREDAHQLIGALFISEQAADPKLFPAGILRQQLQFQDYVTQNRGFVPDQPMPLNPTLALPVDYKPDYPSPFINPMGTPLHVVTGAQNGFNEQLILTDGRGFAPGRMLWSWANSGADDTQATAGKPVGVDVTVTVYQTWMEGTNRPPASSVDGYYYSHRQVLAIWSIWARMLAAIPAKLPAWFGEDTQDTLARQKHFTVSSVIDTGLVPGVTSKMMVWWWNHAMGDAPGTAYSMWCPPAHAAIRWLPGFSPMDLSETGTVPTDHVVPGIIYPDLQGGILFQNGGGMMSYPPSMAPVPGRYAVLDAMIPVSQEAVDHFAKDRFPAPPAWLLHQWEDRPDGLIHRSTVMMRLPLRAPVTQQGFYSEHQLMEGQFWGSQGMRKAYAAWLKQNPG